MTAFKKQILFGSLLALASVAPLAAAPSLRPPATPLIAVEPNFSIWSKADTLTGDVTRHWTNRAHPLTSLIRIDGVAYRLMGAAPASAPALTQTSVTVLPTRSIYTFEGAGVRVQLTFLTPALPNDLEALALPITYLTWTVRAIDGKTHAAAVYFDAAPDLTVNDPSEPVTWNHVSVPGLTALRTGTAAQPILAQGGDDMRVNWGYFYLAAPKGENPKTATAGDDASRAAFAEGGALPSGNGGTQPRAVNGGAPALSIAFDLGKVGATPVSRWIVTAYDEIYSIQYFYENLRPYWRRNGATAETMLQTAVASYPSLQKRSAAFDADLMADLTKAGGVKYAQICALAYRQCLAANGLAADRNGKPLFFTKENTSNGDIATVDVFFPMDPIWLLLSPTLAKASLVPVLNYGSAPRWKFPNSPHDLGTYPIARGTDDGGEQMPVEESGNMLLLCDAVAKADGNANFVTPWWPSLTKWANYLVQFGQDPEDQLCTDDFMGHLAHNANLSIKGILALAAYGDLCRRRGDTVNADKFAQIAKDDAAHWIKASDDGDHSRLAFDKPGTWSQKYNLVWDQVLGLNVFPPSVAKREVEYYKTVKRQYGVPLDSRTHLTKTDWSFWSATLADNQADFETLTDPIYDYVNTTTNHQPFVDSYFTDDIHSDGMHARPVIGGVFIKALANPAIWKKWAGKDAVRVSGWAPMPEITLRTVAAASEETAVDWKYTTTSPGAGWEKPGFDDAAWTTAGGAFGNDTPYHARVETMWNSQDIWLRRKVTLKTGEIKNLQLWASVYGSADFWLNGVQATSLTGARLTNYANLPIPERTLAALKPGANVIAIHCRQTGGTTQFIDAGLVALTERN